MRGLLKLSAGIALVGLLAFVAGTAHGAAQAKRVAFRVTLKATVVKNWNAVARDDRERVSDLASISWATRRHASKQASDDRARHLPQQPDGLVRAGGRAVPRGGGRSDGEQDDDRRGSLHSEHEAHDLRSQAPRRQGREIRASSAAQRNEISFRRTRLPGLPAGCPPESAQVRAIQSGLEEAEGEISEEALADSRVRTQTATGSAEVETDLEDEDTGRVVERVSWKLTFTRKR